MKSDHMGSVRDTDNKFFLCVVGLLRCLNDWRLLVWAPGFMVTEIAIGIKCVSHKVFPPDCELGVDVGKVTLKMLAE